MDNKIEAGDLERIVDSSHHDPFTVLGWHSDSKEDVVRVFVPQAVEARICGIDDWLTLRRVHRAGVFEWRGVRGSIRYPYAIQWRDRIGNVYEMIDPYCFPPLIESSDLSAFANGEHTSAYDFLGANPRSVAGVSGVQFSIWAPNALRVSVVGEHNSWDGRRHMMRVRAGCGIWELFIPGVKPGALYKFEIKNSRDRRVHQRADPYARCAELRPRTASVVCGESDYVWNDTNWLERRSQRSWLHSPLSIYEVHLGSWRRDPNGGVLGYRDIAKQLVDYVRSVGYTHVQLLPITEHPFDGSWGYQTLGYFSPTARFGQPDDFRFFVDYCHQHHIGVLLDWTPAHFPNDLYGLVRLDGTALYEHAHPSRGTHPDWNTKIFNYGRNEVQSFLLSSAHYWVKEFHIDGLRVDAVSSMLYLDFSRASGDWSPNEFGGNENLEAIEFLKKLNVTIHGQHPGVITIAEESSSWPMVSHPTYVGGLGFSMKWNMGWMNDTLSYFSKDPIYRKYEQKKLTFGQMYAFSENFVLPLSHDEVVHGKRSILHKMPGDAWQKFASVRLLFTYMFCMPGKKHLFMGNDIVQEEEWNHDKALDWDLLKQDRHRGVQGLVRDLNRVYRTYSSLHKYDFDHAGFEWLDCNDTEQSIISFQRRSEDEFVLCVFNFTPVPRHNYRIGVPKQGLYRELINSDSSYYGGSNLGNFNEIHSEAVPWMGHDHSISITLPPLAGMILRCGAVSEHPINT